MFPKLLLSKYAFSSLTKQSIKYISITSKVSNNNQYVAPTLAGLTYEQVKKVEKTNEYLRSKHVQLEATLDPAEKDVVRRKRMIYRSKQRGWLEADILLGSWAAKYVPTLTEEELDQYELILNEETIDIFNYVTGKDKLPKHLEVLPLMKVLQEYAINIHLYDPASYEAIKKTTNLT